MSNITVMLGDVTISGDVEKVWNFVRDSDVSIDFLEDYNPFVKYWSETTARRTGDGLVNLADMPDPFLANAFFRRFVDALNAIAANGNYDSEQKLEWARDLSKFAQDIVNGNMILLGLINEINNRGVAKL